MGLSAGSHPRGLAIMAAKQVSKEAKARAAMAGGKNKKKKWSKGKARDKMNNKVLFDKETLEKFQKEVPTYTLITPAVVSDRLKIRGSLARAGIKGLHKEGKIRCV